MESREEILARLETAYRQDSTAEDSTGAGYAEVPDMKDQQETLSFLFGRLQANRIGYHLVADRSELLDSLANNIYSRSFKKVAVWQEGLLDSLKVPQGLEERLPDTQLISIDTLDHQQLAVVEGGLTPVEAIIAQTGTLVVTGGTSMQLATSLLPRTHLCVAHPDQIYPDLSAFISSDAFDPSANYVLISGPSRTADIEKKIVLGVHGPWRVSLFLVREVGEV